MWEQFISFSPLPTFSITTTKNNNKTPQQQQKATNGSKQKHVTNHPATKNHPSKSSPHPPYLKWSPHPSPTPTKSYDPAWWITAATTPTKTDYSVPCGEWHKTRGMLHCIQEFMLVYYGSYRIVVLRLWRMRWYCDGRSSGMMMVSYSVCVGWWWWWWCEGIGL